jgi:putative DNA primase/helicase
MPQVHPTYGKPSKRWPYCSADGLLFEVWRFDPVGERKQFCPLTLWRARNGRVEWRFKSPPSRRPLYGLGRLAEYPDYPVIVVEGEKACDAAAKVFTRSVCITSLGGAQAASKADWEPLAGRNVLVLPDCDEAGTKYANEVAAILHKQSCEVSIIDAYALASLSPDGGQREPAQGWDDADAIEEWKDVKALQKAAIELAEPYEPAEPDFDHEIARLSKLTPLQYECERAATAKKLGVRSSVLDRHVKDARPDESPKGRPLEFSEPMPWGHPVSGAALLDEIAASIGRFVVCDEPARIATSLWIAATWFEESMQVAPILNLQSPEKRCGKTTLLSLPSKLVRRPLPASSISAAAIFRVIEECKPTLLIDEADAFLNENEEARGIINSGHTRDAAFVIRVEGDGHEPRRFSTWGFKAISGIGRRAATIEDRSIAIKLKRKAGNEKVARLRHEPKETFDGIVRKLARFSQDNVLAVSRARPELPDALNDRAHGN